MQINPLTAAHAMAYKALMLHAYEHAADSFTSTPQERSLESDSWWRSRIDDPSGLTWVWGAFAGAELVGTVSVEYGAKPKHATRAWSWPCLCMNIFAGKVWPAN